MFNQISRLRLGIQYIRNLFRRSGRHLRDSLPTLQTQEIASIKSNLSYRHYKPGVEIIQSGDLADNFYVIIKGRVEILDRKQRSLSTLETGDFFGEIGLLEDGRRSASIRSLESVELIQMDKKTFEYLLQTSPSTKTVIERIASERTSDGLSGCG